MSLTFENSLGVLRAAAESTRLRLLAVLRHGELTVGEITAVLGQSQPRVSRHLKLLCDMGLLDRFREEHWMYYRVPARGAGAVLVRQLLALVEPEDATFRRDRERMATVTLSRGGNATPHTATESGKAVRPQSVTNISKRDGSKFDAAETGVSISETVVSDADQASVRLDAPNAFTIPLQLETLAEVDADFSAAVASLLGNESLGDLLDIGTGSGSMLRLLGARASHAVGLDISSLTLRRARGRVHGAGLSHCVFRRGDMHNLPFTQPEFDTVMIDRALVHTDSPVDVLREAVRVLRPGGRLLLIDDYERLAELGGNPLVEMRRWLTSAGLQVDRLAPLDTPHAHLLLSECRRLQSRIAA